MMYVHTTHTHNTHARTRSCACVYLGLTRINEFVTRSDSWQIVKCQAISYGEPHSV